MPRIDTLTGIAADDVSDLKQEYKDDGATVTVTADGHGTYVLVATYPTPGEPKPSTGSDSPSGGDNQAGTGNAPAGLSATANDHPQSMGLPLTQAGLNSACQQLGVEPAVIWAIIQTETDFPHGGFLPDARPQILYEQHIFHRLTQGAFDQSHPDISSSKPGNYGAAGAHQYDRLAAARSLNESAALQSASWGLGQTLGENYKLIGYQTPKEMVYQMYLSEDQQLAAMVQEIKASKVAGALAAHDWTTFARVYNGPNFAINNYPQRLNGFYNQFSGGTMPDLTIRAAQLYLTYAGFYTSEFDGTWGPITRAALNQFQRAKGLTETDQLDLATYAVLVKSRPAVNAPDRAVGGKAVTVPAKPNGGFAAKVIDTASNEWKFFGQQEYDLAGRAVRIGHKEGEDGWFQRVGRYWAEGTNTEGIDGQNHDMPWSAAFISWVMRTSGAASRFRYSTQHSVYIYQAIRDRQESRASAGYWAWRLNEYKPARGDLVCWARESGVDYDNQKGGTYKSHCDVIVQVDQDRCWVIGGNVGDSVTKRPLPLTGAGYLASTSSGGEGLFAIMEDMIG
jgi:hypothetical protein